MSIQYIRGQLSFDPTLYDASLNNDGLISRVQKSDATAPGIIANKFALSCIVQGDGVVYSNTGTVAVPIWTPLGSPLSLTRILSSAEILSIGTNPLILFPAPGVGLSTVITTVYTKTNFATTPYVGTNSDLQMRVTYVGTPTAIAANIPGSVLLATTDVITNVATPPGSAGLIQENTDIQISNTTGVNPTVGDSSVTLYVEYKIITL